MTSYKYNSLVSVIIPTYNCANFITKTLESIINQSYSNIEILIVDDGSNDATPDIVNNVIKSDNRVRYLWKQNGGQASARNMGIEHSGGDFIAFCDSDDYWEPNKLSLQMPLFNNHLIGVCYSDAEIFNSDTGDVIPFDRGKYLALRRGNILGHLLSTNFIVHSSIVIRKSCFNVVGVFDETIKMGDDWDMLLRLATRYEFDYCAEKLVFYRIARQGQLSNKVLNRIESNQQIFEKYIKQNPGVIDKKAINKAKSVMLIVNAWTLINIDVHKSVQYCLNAIKCNPTSVSLYLFLIKSLVVLITNKKSS